MADEPKKSTSNGEEDKTPKQQEQREKKLEITAKTEKQPVEKKEKKVKNKQEVQPSEAQAEQKTDNLKKPTKKDAAKQLPPLRSGQKVRIHQKIQEGKKERIQVFEGIVLAIKGKTPATKTITVRKLSGGVAVEKIFPLAMPTLEKIEIVSKLNTRKAKVYYLRNYKKKLKEEKV